LSSDILRPDFTIGYLGAGQLARMSAVEAFRYGWRVGVYTNRSSDEPVEFMTPLSQKGSFDDVEALTEFASGCDIVTLENEFLDAQILKETQKNSDTPIYPSPETFSKIENKLIEKQTFEAAGIPVTPYQLVDTIEEVESFADKHGWPLMLKSSKGGYDGYGNVTVNDSSEARDAFDELGADEGHAILAEAFISFEKELAVQVARNGKESVVYPCCETVQEQHINKAVLSPAPIRSDLRRQAEELAVAATEALGARGLFAYEFFLTSDDEILLNESAPRPHNSGHYSIEGSVTSQFENHVRAVAGLPLGDTSLRSPSVVMINLLGDYERSARVDHADNALAASDGHLHMYGKADSKIGRKMGHYTLLGEDMDQTYEKALELTDSIEI
jgi:5-(carboxyamino)imidazole ribonucleotide synthase